MKSRDQDEVTHLRAELDALSRISRNISMRLEVQRVLETILQEVGGFFGTERLQPIQKVGRCGNLHL